MNPLSARCRHFPGTTTSDFAVVGQFGKPVTTEAQRSQRPLRVLCVSVVAFASANHDKPSKSTTNQAGEPRPLAAAQHANTSNPVFRNDGVFAGRSCQPCFWNRE